MLVTVVCCWSSVPAAAAEAGSARQTAAVSTIVSRIRASLDAGRARPIIECLRIVSS
jgi:hypothetical protein